jgi:hypothetical protein
MRYRRCEMSDLYYKPLATSFKRAGSLIKLIQRTANIALYEARNPKDCELLRGYIVAKIRNKKATTLKGGKVLCAREIFPAPSKFGKDGWFYMPTSLSAANAHFEELLANEGGNSYSGSKSKKAA